MTGPPTRVRRLHDAAVDPLTPMWRGAAVFRVLTFAFVLGVQLTFSTDYARPGLSWVLVGLIGVWTVITVWAFSVADGGRVWLAVADVAVVTALMASTLLVQTPEQVADPTPTITTLWSANPVVTAAVLAGARVGTAVGALVAAISLLVNGHITTSLARDSVILLLLGAVLGVVADTARRSHAALAQALRAEAALVEREHLARAVHDSVLQVLAFVRREGATLGGPGAELARLAGDQEIALRALVATPAREGAHGEVDLRALLQEQANPVVSVSVPGTPVPLPAAVAEELAAVAGAALSNTALHAGEQARAFVLLEDLGNEVVLSIRDDGVDIAPGRLAQAQAQGRIGVAHSIRGRVRDLGGRVQVESAPGAGTEWEVRLPRTSAAAGPRAGRGDRG